MRSSSHHNHHQHHHRGAPSHRGSWNIVILFCLSMLVTGIMFQRATTSVQRTDNEIQAATTATDAVLVNGEKSIESLNEKKYTPEITQIISSILSQAKDAINTVSQSNDHEVISNDNQFYGMNEEEASRLVKTLLSRVKTALTWVSSLNKNVNRFDRIANGEIHILYKLHRFLRQVDQALTDTTTSHTGKTIGKDLVALINKGYQCSNTDMLQQEAIAKTIERDICSEIEWYKVIQMAWPEATKFIDIGANKGYLGSLFLSLWGGGGLRVNPAVLYETTTKLKTWAGSKNTAGFCRDGLNYGLPLHCPNPSLRDDTTGLCHEKHPKVRVYSIDGSSHLEHTMNKIIQTQLPPKEKGEGQGESQSQGKGRGSGRTLLSPSRGVASSKNPPSVDVSIILPHPQEEEKITMTAALTMRAKKLGLPPPNYGVSNRGLAATSPTRRGRKGVMRGNAEGNGDREMSGISGDSSSSDSSSSSSSGDGLVVGNGDTAISAMWRYFHYAASDRRGTVYFTKQGAGAKQGAGFEGGQIQKGASEDSEAVPMISVDDFLSEQGISNLDILKIDAEGNDIQVIRGAGKALNTTVGVFTFEGNGVMFDKNTIDSLDRQGYSCYSTSRAGLFKWNSGCMTDRLIGGASGKSMKGNVFCAHRGRVPMVTLAFDALSFPLMIRQAMLVQPTIPSSSTSSSSSGSSSSSSENGGSDGSSSSSSSSLDVKILTKAYVNIKPFCQQPSWPKCALEGIIP